MKAFEDIVKQRDHINIEIGQAYNKITKLQEQVNGLFNAIQNHERLLVEYNDIIEKLAPFYEEEANE